MTQNRDKFIFRVTSVKNGVTSIKNGVTSVKNNVSKVLAGKEQGLKFSYYNLDASLKKKGSLIEKKKT